MNKLVLELLADSNGLLKGLDRAQTSIDRFTKASTSAGQSLGGGVNRALEAFEGLATGGATAAGVLAGGIVAAATAAVLLTTNAGKQVEAIDQLSQKTGIAVQAIQGWSVIMAENGFQAETLTGSMRTLSKQMVEARDPASQAASTFEDLGISVTALGSTESTIRAVADKFKDLPDGPDKARLAVTLFGKAGLEMIPMLNRGAGAFDESRAASERFGAVLSIQQVAALNAVDDASDRLGVAMDGLKLQLAATFAPAVEVSINAITAAIGKLTTGLMGAKTGASSFFEEFKQKHPLISSILLGDVAGHAAPPPLFPPAVTGPQQDSHVAEFALASGQRQEELGMRIRNQLIEKYKLLQAEGHAQEALGKFTIASIQRETEARNTAFAMQLEQAEQVNDLQFEKVSSGNASAFDAHLAAVKNLMALMPELTSQEAALLAIRNSSAAQNVLDDSRMRLALLNETASALAVHSSTEQAYADNAASKYRQLGAVFGDVDTARKYAFDAIDASLNASVARLDAQLAHQEISWSEYYQRTVQLDLDADAKRRGVAQQLPTFFEQQMQSIVASNAFSVGQIVTTWTSGLANAVVNGGNFALAAWKSTQVALLQGVLNTGVQLAAQWALNASVELGILSATEAAKMGLKTASEAEQTAAAAAGATARKAIAQGEATTAFAMFAAIGTALKALFVETVLPAILAVGKFVVGVLTAIAGAMKATIFGIPVGIAVLVGVAALVAALAATGNLGFKDGGIGDFGSGTPTTLHGQEAIIPLNGRGAAFMQSVFGAGGGGREPIHTHVYLNGREMARAISDEQPGALRTMGAF